LRDKATSKAHNQHSTCSKIYIDMKQTYKVSWQKCNPTLSFVQCVCRPICVSLLYKTKLSLNFVGGMIAAFGIVFAFALW
jgi:hypothetical protein